MATLGANTLDSYTHFLKKDPLYDGEKPYSLRFTPPKDFAGANIKLERHKLRVRDVRDEKDELSLAKDGCVIWDFRSQMTYKDFDDDSKVREVYLTEVADALRNQLGAERVQIFEHTVKGLLIHPWAFVDDGQIRKQHDEFPISTGEPL